MFMTSPFSGFYTVKSYPVRRPSGPRTPRELILKNIVLSAGAAASFTLGRFYPNRRSLRSLSRAGLFSRHVLTGEDRELEVYSREPSFDLASGLKMLAAAEFYALLRQSVPCCLTPLKGMWVLSYRHDGKMRHKQVLVVRKGENPVLYLPLLKHPTILVCETLTDAFKGCPVRLVLDMDLLSGVLRFYLPDGNIDNASPFAPA